ncbi:MAG: AarF/ABC1/UbiB kinase family protein [Alphaproteobacteria bacterium]|nr:AarF/ABC1/UbiB kinase family protein [Alphaproteobacteria bacterium]MCB9695697.1 AarF/ABC1/UbiB kinase family protein [Alphaproteobacteria bacterium]
MTHPSPRRLSEVVTTFMLEGLHVPAARMRITHCATLRCRAHCTWARWTGRRVSEHPWPVGVRMALTRLGPAFVKIGQILSVRTDLVPAELARELHSLQSDVPPVPFDQIRETVEREMGMPLDQAFARFDVEPLAAGSVAQVHVGELPTGEKVAVKVKRPQIDHIVDEDLEILVWLAERMERFLPAARPYRPVAAARELAEYTRRELDFRNEAQVGREVGRRFESWDGVRVPKVHHGSRDLIVMDFVEGFPMDDVEALERHGIDPHALMQRGLEAVLAQIFDFGLFHADPHPGNLHVTPTGEIVLLDFGIFGRVDDRMRRDCALLMWALGRGDVDLASYFLLRMARVEPGADVAAFREAVEARYRAWHGKSVAEYGFAKLVYEELTIGARYGLVFPSDTVLLGKALVTVEGVVLAVDPSMDLSKEADPYLNRLKEQLFSVDRLREGLERSLPIWWELAERLPLGAAELLERGVWPVPTPAEATAPGRDRTVVWAALVLVGGMCLVTALPPVVSGWSVPGAALVFFGMVGALRW